MILRVFSFLNKLHGFKNLSLMMIFTVIFVFLEVFGLGFFILIILEILSTENSLCNNSESIFFNVVNFTNLCSDSELSSKLFFITLFFFLKFLIQSSIIIYKSKFLSNGIFKFIELNILRILKIKVDKIEEQDFFKDNNTLIKEADILFNSFFNKFFDCLTEVLIFSLLILFLVIYDTKNFLLILLILPFCYFYFFSFSNRTKKSGENRQISLTKLNQKFYNIFKNKRIIEILSREKYAAKSFVDYLKIYRKSTFYHFSIIYLPRVILENFLFILISLIIILSINFTSRDQTLSIFTIYGLVFLRLIPSINRIKNSLDTLLFRLNSFNLVQEVNSRYKLLSINNSDNTISLDFENSSIDIHNLNITTKEKIFINAKLNLEKNKFHCITGPSGSGKSTLLNFLSGFKKAESFTVNKKIEKNEKYLKIIDTSYLSQKIFFEDTTLIDNLLIGEEKNEFNKNKIIELMKKLKLENFISELDKKVEFDGSNFSLGEQQRFLIIRSILKKPKVLILDEPFSSLDKENQKNLIEFLMEYKNKFTLIMSTHVNFSSDLFDLNFQIKDKKLERL